MGLPSQVDGRGARGIIAATLRLMRLRGISRLDPYSRVLPRLFPHGVKVRLASGATLRMPMDHPFWLKVIRRGYQELATERLLMAGLRPGDTLIDVGAHRGTFTVIGGQRVGSAGHVYAFEPDPKHVQGLKRAIRINRLANVTIEHCAVGEADATARFAQTRAGYERFPPWDPRGNTGRAAPMVALDTYLREKAVGGVRILKIDVDGPELTVLQGGRRLLASPEPPLIVMELSRLGGAWGAGYRTVRASLLPFGYALYGCERTRGDVIPLPSDDLPWNLTTTTVTLAAAVPALHRAAIDEVLRLQGQPVREAAGNAAGTIR